MRKKLVVVSSSLIIVLVIVAIISAIKDNNKVLIDVCSEIKSSKEDHSNFVVSVEGTGYNDYLLNHLNDFLSEYSEINIVKTKYDKIEKDCFKKELERANIYKVVKSSTVSSLIFYVKGQYNGLIIGDYDYKFLENYAYEVNLIKKHKINETLTVDSFKNKIKDEYILILLGEEKARNVVTDSASKYFKDYDYDIVYAESDEGNKIFDYILDNFTIDSMFPQALYFRNGKLLLDKSVYDLSDDYKNYVNEIENLNS